MTRPTKTNLKLTDEDTRKEAIERLGAYFPLQIGGYDCTADWIAKCDDFLYTDKWNILSQLEGQNELKPC